MVAVMKHWMVCGLTEIGGDDQHTAGRRLLRRLLAAEGLDAGQAIALKDGKPFLTPHSTEGSAPAISIAHSAHLAAAAICRIGLVGIDLELHNSTRNFAGIAETYFGPQEAAQVTAGGMRAFYRIWTLREAIGKATGEGLLTDRRDRIINAAPYTGAWVSDDRQWLLAHIEPRAGISLALAIQPDKDTDTSRWSLDAIQWPVGLAMPAISKP